jgi:hypothetical protein
MRDLFKKFTGHFLPSADNAYRPHLLRKSWLLFFLSIILTAESLFIVGIMAEQSARDFLSAVLPGEVIALTNGERTKVGDGAVSENTLLSLAAQNKAQDMAARGYFSHTGPDGKEPWAWISEAGYTYRYAGENLAVRFDESADVVNAWMASPTHRANIVKPVYTEIGIGVAQGMYEGAPATFVVQYFGTPQAQAAAVQAAEAPSVEEPIAANTVSTAVEVAGASIEEKQTELAANVMLPQEETPAPLLQPEAPDMQSTVRAEAQTFLRASDASQASVAWILGGVAILLLLLIALAVLVHIEIQPTEMILGGTFVGVVAASLLMLNTAFDQNPAQLSQSAAVLNAYPAERSVIVGSDAASIEVVPLLP